MLAEWTEEKGASGNLGEGACWEEVHKTMGSSGAEGASLPSSRHRPVCAVLGGKQRWEGGGGRRVGGRKGGRRKRGRGGQPPENRYELRSPAFSLSVGMVGRARHTGTAAAGAREGTSFTACTACPGRRAEAQNPVLGLPGLRNLGERGNFLPSVLGFGFGELLCERLILPLESAGSPGGQASPGPPD